MKEISGDRPLSRIEQVRYICIFIKRFFGLFVRVPCASFNPPTTAQGSASFFRRYIDAFLTEKIPELLSKRTIGVFDIGCGSGYVRTILEQCGYSGTYTGLDVVREKRFDDFETQAFPSMFVQSGIETYIPTDHYDLVLTNTSLEHVDDDQIAVVKAHQLRGNGGVEIHIVPSWWSFFLYLWHGYRHYTPGKIKQLFEGSNYTVYRLGGLASFVTHFFVVTIAERFMGLTLRTKQWYPRLSSWCFRVDRYIPLCPIGYAITVELLKTTE